MGLTKRDFLFAGAMAAVLSGAAISGCTQTTEAPTTVASAPAETAAPLPKDAAPSAPAGDTAMGAGTNNPGTMPEPPGPGSEKGAPPMMGGGKAPFAGGGMGGDPTAPLSASPELDKKIADAEKSKDKKAITAAYTERGAARMYDEKAGQRTKYRAALEDFRKALAADPTNKDAKASKDTIESIYTSMGRPVPK